MAKQKQNKRPHSEMEPDTPPHGLAIPQLKSVMQDLLHVQFNKLDLDGLKKGIKSITGHLPKH